MHGLLDGRGVRAGDAEDELDVQRRVDETLLEQVENVVDVPTSYVSNSGFVPASRKTSARRYMSANVVSEDVFARRLEILDLPGSHLGAVAHLEDPEGEAARV